VKSKSGGVGSEFETKYIQIKEVKIGSYLIKNLVAIVPLRSDINDLLIGIRFLKKFKEVEWPLNANSMRFYK
jgi:predicted aspartyl protease